MTNIIILLGNLEDITKLDELIKNPNSKKICFDYQSHKILTQNGIECTFVEEYFDEKDQILLDELTIQITTNWYKNKDIIRFLECHGINIGELLEQELLLYFFSQIKKVIGVLKIIQKENPDKIITSSLSNFVSTINNKFEHI
ncbi:MAG: hypothetical protein EPO37_09310, partial [Nitrosarchaeum sp.]